ncbi:Octanoyltransferase [Gimesia alba]|uniref:Octanoyltransferase n=2 Tax=Gimesia alba TaxID=2527973 RepID=A0A517RJX0_9PLAN|nr:Octanoyltransferase [Gimesia alba]
MNIELSPIERAHHQDRTMKIYMLGCVDFDSLLVLQERAVQELRRAQNETAVLFICEHPPLITVGREGSHAQLSGSYQELKAGQIEVRWVNRGGGAILHTPGQLAVYPVLPLKQLGIGVQDYLSRLEQAIIAMAAEQGVEAQVQPGSTGISSRCGQFACLGAAIKSWISYYGFYINVSPDMKLLRLIDSNRYDHRLTSLSATLTREASMSSVRESIVRNLVSRFGYRDTPIFTRHPLLNRVKKKVYVHT